jgi:predicted RNA methylase
MSLTEPDRRALAALSASDRRRLGAVYTPPAEVALAVSLALGHWRGEPERARVCDPACGAGAFLAGYLATAGAVPAALVGVDADANAVAIASERLPGATILHGDALVTAGGPFAWGRDLPPRFDVVVGNPPYVRHQDLVDPLGRAGRYGEAVAAAVTALAPGLRLSRRADLSAAFLALGVSLLAENGVLAFVTSSAWLDASYGEPLGRFLLDAGLVEVAERPAERTFAGADVGSVIVVVRRGADGPVRFRRVGRDVRAVERGNLAARPKWGGRLLRAPAVLDVLEDALAGAPALGEVARIGGYLVTGADAFFYRTPAGAAARGLDPSLLRPVVKSTRGERRIVLDGPPARLLLSCADPASWAGTPTGAVLADGVADGVPERSGVRARRVWSEVPQEPGPVLCVRTARDRHLAYLNPERRASGELYRVFPPDGVTPVALAAFLNSAVVGLQLEALGRAYGGGGGPLKVERQDLARLLVPAPADLRAAAGDLEAAVAPLLERPIGTVGEEALAADREPLEALCGRLCGLDTATTAAVRAAHVAAVSARVERARHVLD